MLFSCIVNYLKFFIVNIVFKIKMSKICKYFEEGVLELPVMDNKKFWFFK